jgi:GT2 family glycosyltransferase
VGAGRPDVDVVVPFRGDDAGRADLLARLTALALRDGDTLTVVDNGPRPPPQPAAQARLIHAPERPTSYFARNRGAELGRAGWILFLDADVLAPADLLDRYFEARPDTRTGVLAGGVRDEAADGTLAERYAARRAPMADEVTLGRGEWSYAMTANCVVRRAAFEALGGFDERVRSGGDADLCFRARRAGWALERRPDALVVHRNRTTLRALARQKARHGAGAAWLARAYPGAFDDPLTAGTVWWSARRLGAAALAGARGDRDAAAIAGVDVLAHWAFHVGRLLPNEPRPR